VNQTRGWRGRAGKSGKLVTALSLIVIALAITIMLTACAGNADTGLAGANVAPTVAPEFKSVDPANKGSTAVVLRDPFSLTPSPISNDATSAPADAAKTSNPPANATTPSVDATAWVTTAPIMPAITATPQPVIYEIPVYRGAGTLSPGWSVTRSWAVTYSLAAPGRSLSGTHAISMAAQADYGTLFFGNTSDSGREYSRTQVIGLRMFLNAGDQTIMPGDLAFTVLGSNAYTYYVIGDTSVPTTTKMFFSESRLDELGLMRPLPPNTWVELDINLDSLIYDPDYKYVTAFYIKTDIGFRQTVYIDNISMIMVK